MKKISKREIKKLLKIVIKDNYLDTKNDKVIEPYDEFYRYIGTGALKNRYIEVLTVNDNTKTYSLKIYKNWANYFLDIRGDKNVNK